MTSDPPRAAGTELLGPADLLVLADDQVSADLTGETVILSMRDGVYYGLDRVGTHVWLQMREPARFDALVASVVRTFEVEESRAAADLSALLRELAARGLAEIRPAPNP